MAVDSKSIRLSWEAPPPDTWNGVITNYVICFSSLANPSDLMNLTTNETEVLVEELYPDSTYQFTVAAETVAIGPTSTPVVQRSYPLPPPLDDKLNVSMVSMSTISLSLPPVNSSLFR